MRLYENRPSGTVDRAKTLRRAAPEPERRLLRALRSAFPNLKWRHQVPLGPYHADILCFSERLVIEVDGDTHDPIEDAARDAFAAREGYRTLRIGNPDVMGNIDGVMAGISLSLRERMGSVETRAGEAIKRNRGGPA